VGRVDAPGIEIVRQFVEDRLGFPARAAIDQKTAERGAVVVGVGMFVEDLTEMLFGGIPLAGGLQESPPGEVGGELLLVADRLFAGGSDKPFGTVEVALEFSEVAAGEQRPGIVMAIGETAKFLDVSVQ
jgi:hypothetical protein